MPGAKELIDFLQNNNKQFLFLTNDSATTPKDLQQNLSQHGIDISESHFYTSGQATAEFLHSQMPEVIISIYSFLIYCKIIMS